MPADESVKSGDIEEIIPLNRASFDIDKETDIATEKSLALAQTDGPYLEMSTITIVEPSRLDIRRPLLESKTIGHRTGSPPMLCIGGNLYHEFTRFFTGIKELGKGLWRRKKLIFVSSAKEETEIIASIAERMG